MYGILCRAMTKRQRRQRTKRSRHIRLAHTPPVAALAVVGAGLAGFAGPADVCMVSPCADDRGGEVLALSPNFDIGPVPTQANYTPIITVQAPSVGGTAVARPPRLRWDV